MQRLKEQPESGGPQDIEGESAQAKRRSRDASALGRTSNRDAGSEAKAEVEPDVTEPEVEPLVEPEVDRETQESANQDERLEDSNEVEAGAENQESALLSGVIDSGDAEVEPGLEPGDKLASEPENKVADESGVASVGNEVANAATRYDRKSKKKGDKGTRRSKYQGGTRVSGAKAGQGDTTSLAGMSRKAAGRGGKDVVIEKAKVRLLPGRPSGQDSAAVRTEVEEIKEYVRGDRGNKRHLDSSRRSVGVVDTAKRVTESYRKSDTAKRMSKNEKLEVEVFVTELGDSGTQTLEPGSDGALLKGHGSSEGDGGGASQKSRGQRPVGKTKGGVGLTEREGASIPSVQRLVAATGSVVSDGLAETTPGTESGNVEGDGANNHIDREGAGERNNEVAAADEGQDVKQSSQETTTGESAAGNLSADDERSEDEAVRSHSASQALGDSAEPVKDNENRSGEANLFKESEIESSVAELQGSSGFPEDGTTDLEAHKAEDGLYDPEQGIKESQESHQEAFANTNLTGSPSGQEPSTTEEASRTEEDSAYVDGTSTTTPSPAVSRADVISPKDIHGSETADEGISVDEMPPTRDSNRDEEEASTDAASSSGRGSRGTVSEVPLVIHKPQIRTPKNDATAKYKVRPPKGLTLFPQRFKTSPKGAQKTGQSEVSRVTGMRRVRSDGETLDKTGGSRTVLTTPGSSEKGSSLLGRNSRSVNMEEQGLVEIARLQKKLDGLREERLFCEAKREDLLRRAKFLQNKTTSTRDQARDMWRRRYSEERKTTPKLEEECSRWRMELERLHRELLAKVEGELRVTGYPRLEQPSNKLSYKIVIAKIIQEIEDLKRRLDYTRISLGAEVRLRTHAEREVKNLREDLLKKKIQVTLTKKETQSVMAPFLRDSFYFVGPI
ncbi:hypothetical protein HPB47_012472 [Ixodes persulcatus]|uniref:Uncharacterized protein n=1 Tax=Ixodes persulcatus TaxID=34615 RepID=A0AC60NTD7_IXOPE|nr:hypothetical protein HPB47_012472 [Ixodes persulcatus]